MTSAGQAEGKKYEPNWESIDSRPTPAWFDEIKFGIFIHWGLYSVPAFGPKGKYSEWYWHELIKKDDDTRAFHNRVYGEDFKYPDFARDFTCELFDPAEWADLFKRAGAKYVVLTSKHHDGYCLWPSRESWNWNSVDTGPHRDLCGDLSEAVKAAGLKMGFYYSLYEWYNPQFREDTDAYVEQHMIPQLKDLVLRYEPSLVWTDGEWDRPSEVWRSVEYLAWLFNESPVRDEIAVNDRWGKECRSNHGGFYTTEYGHVGWDQPLDEQNKWEECRGIGASFGYNRNETLSEYSTPNELIHLLVDTVAKGGNLLLDIGPTSDGRIPVIMEQRLVEMGNWLAVNGEAIYGTRPWLVRAEGDGIRYTAKDDVVYAICLDWPEDELVLEAPVADDSVGATLLGHDAPLEVSVEGDAMRIAVPRLSVDEAPSRYAHVFKLTGVKDARSPETDAVASARVQLRPDGVGPEGVGPDSGLPQGPGASTDS